MKINVLVALAGLATAALFAQEYRGTFSGSVTDPQGAAIPGAKIVATETRTGTKATVTSDAAGAYSFQFLAARRVRDHRRGGGIQAVCAPGVDAQRR